MVLNFRSAMASSFAVTSSDSRSNRWTTPRCTCPTSFESSLRMATILCLYLPLMLSSSLISRSIPAMYVSSPRLSSRVSSGLMWPPIPSERLACRRASPPDFPRW